MNKFKKFAGAAAAFILPCVLCFLCFGLVWFQYLQDVPEKSQSKLLNDRYDSSTNAIAEGDVYTQDFTIDGKISGFGLNFNIMDQSLDGTFKVKLINTDTDEILMDYENIIGAISPTSYTCMILDKPLTEKGLYNLRASIEIDYKTPQLTQGQLISLKKSSTVAKNFGVLKENGTETEGSLAMLVMSDVLGNLPVLYYWYTGIAASVGTGILGLLYFVLKKKRAVAVFLTVLLVSFMYQAVLPVHSAPDEGTHYTTAYRISNKWLGIDNEKGVTLKRECDNKYTLRDYNTSAYTYRYIMIHLGEDATVNNGDNLEKSDSEYLSNYDLPYYMTSALLTACRQMNVGGVATTFLSRLPNTLLYCAMLTAAWYITPLAKAGFLAVGLLPISIHIGTSLSYDCYVLSFAFFIIALCLNIALSDGKAKKEKLIILAVLCILIAPLKAAYILLPMLMFIIPDNKFESRKSAVLFKIIVLAVCFLHFGKYNLYIVKKIAKQTLGTAAGTSATVAGAVVAKAAAAESTVAEAAAAAATTSKVANFSIGYIISNPGIRLKLVINTFFEKFTYYFNTMMGGYLGYLNLAEVEINPLIISAFTATVALAFIPENTEAKTLKIYQRFIALIIAGGTLVALVVACIMWTPVNYTYIWGFQGRYFLPVLPLLLIALQPAGIKKNKDLTISFLCILLALNVFTVLNAFVEIMAR